VKNMNFGRKGQGAMEYLMTYGWAILVVMVVGIVMWQLGIFNIGGVTSTTSTGFPRLRPQLALMSMNTTGYFKGTFTNGAGGPIIITAVTGDCAITPAANTYSAGENFQLSGDCAGVSGSAGDPYDVTLDISYNVTLAGITSTHTDHGTIRGPFE